MSVEFIKKCFNFPLQHNSTTIREADVRNKVSETCRDAWQNFTTTRWSDVRNTVSKGCRLTTFYVKDRLQQFKPFSSPRSDLERNVMKKTGFPRDVAGLVADYTGTQSSTIRLLT